MKRPGGIVWQLFVTFFKIGLFTFGGGWAMISIIQKELVDRHHWLDEDEFLEVLAVAQSLPGILAVNMAASMGDRIAGRRGSILAAFGSIVPSFIIILLIAVFLTPETIKGNTYLSAAFKGIRPAVVALIIAPVISAARAAKVSWRTCWIPAAVALLIWSRLPVVSNPIIYIVLAALVGWLACRNVKWKMRNVK